jgi:drug/metabolite transporter (DMT)-like permease
VVKAVVLILLASIFTATASVCQKKGVNDSQKSSTLATMLNSLKNPVWILGVICMIAGFPLQVVALRYGPVSLVQPLFSSELFFVFVILTLINRSNTKVKDAGYALLMSIGLGLFLFAANPKKGHGQTSLHVWLLAGALSFGISFFITAVVMIINKKSTRFSKFSTVIMGICTGTSWGFLSTVTKQFTNELNGFNLYEIFTNIFFYTLVVLGALTMFQLTKALSAGPLALSQPGLTLTDPTVATILGLLIFHESVSSAPINLFLESAGLVLVTVGVIGVSRSKLIEVNL